MGEMIINDGVGMYDEWQREGDVVIRDDLQS